MKQILQWRSKRKQSVKIVGMLVAVGLFFYLASQGIFSQTFNQVIGWIAPRIRNPIEFFVVIGIVAILSVLIGGYRYKWAWTGFRSHTNPKTDDGGFFASKTLWDWMQLLLIPAVIASGALIFNYWNINTQNAIASDNQHETAFQSYVDKMSELILERHLLTSESDDQNRQVARTRTLTTLRTLDGERKGILLRFLYDSQLINFPSPIIDLEGADLSKAQLARTFLTHADLHSVDLSDGNLEDSVLALYDSIDKRSRFSCPNVASTLRGSNLMRANLQNAFLSGVSLYGADLRDADLSFATLNCATLFGADLRNANLNGAFLQDANLVLAKLDGAKLNYANLTSANLSFSPLGGSDVTNADLSDAILSGSNITTEQLAKARSLKGAIMPDGTKDQ